MSPLTPVEHAERPMMEPESTERLPMVLLTFFLLSLLAHTGTFLLFQVVYPQHATLPLAPPQVALLTPSTPEAVALLRRIEADDPALVAGGTQPLPENIWTSAYRPSFEVVRTQPRAIIDAPAGPEFPPAVDPLALVRSGSPTTPAPVINLASQPTRVTFSPPLAGRQLARGVSWSFSQPAGHPLERAQFLIGVSDTGEVRHVFKQRPSGDDRVDREVAAQLAALRFAPGQPPLSWGFASVVFGDDVYVRREGSNSSTP
ncbi:MAG: hypothetical protein M3463_15975 [Verrucomicrobiota bacterium]|nr:hypothetical protein [Verrucomicrobiota bacterium]